MKKFLLISLLLAANVAYATDEDELMGLGMVDSLATKIATGMEDQVASDDVTAGDDITAGDDLVVTDDVTIGDDASFAAGGTISIQEATAGSKCMGTATANGTTAVTVSTTCALTGSRILITRSSAPSGTAQCWQTNIVTGTSFDLDCDGAETGTFDWFIIHEAA